MTQQENVAENNATCLTGLWRTFAIEFASGLLLVGESRVTFSPQIYVGEASGWMCSALEKLPKHISIRFVTKPYSVQHNDSVGVCETILRC